MAGVVQTLIGTLQGWSAGDLKHKASTHWPDHAEMHPHMVQCIGPKNDSSSFCLWLQGWHLCQPELLAQK